MREQYRLLEALAERLASVILKEYPTVEVVRLKVCKERPPMETIAARVCVEIERTR